MKKFFIEEGGIALLRFFNQQLTHEARIIGMTEELY